MSILFNLISSLDPKGFKQAESSMNSVGGKAAQFGKKVAAAAAVAAAAVAAFAVKLGVDAVKAAAEDEKAQLALAQQLKNVTNATDDQIASVEDYIKQASLATGITDGQLRPAFQKLVTATGDVAQAQYLTNLAMDIAGGTGKSLESVTMALSKAMAGQTSSLTRLGVPLDENAVKTKDLNAIVKQLSDTYGGQAAVAADTFQGKMARLQVAFDEALETVGVFIIDAITPLVDWIVKHLIPAVERFANWIGPKLKPMIEATANFIRDTLIPALINLWNGFQKYVLPALISTWTYLKDKFIAIWEKVSKHFEENREEAIMMAKVIGVTLYGAFKAILWLIERFADYLENTIDKGIAFNKAMKAAIPILQEYYKWLKLGLQAMAYFSPLAKAWLDGLNKIEEGIQSIASIDLSFGGEQAAESWLKGWGVGWESAPDDFFGDFKFNADQTFNVDIPKAVESGANKAADKLKEYQEKLKSKLQALKDEFKSFRDEVRSSIIDAIDFGAAFQDVEDAKKEAAENGEEFGGSFLDALLTQAEKAKEFAEKIQKLVEMGLSKDAIQEVLQAGSVAGSQIADELIAGGSEAINKTNELVDSTKKAANKVAKFAADTYYGTGVETAKKMVAGFKDLIKEGGKGFKELMDAMDKLAKKLAREVKLTVKTSTGTTVSGGTTVPELASGGIVTRPTLAIIGERGAEAVVPLGRNRKYGIDPVGHGGIVINVSGALDPESVARQIETILKRSTLRAGAYS